MNFASSSFLHPFHISKRTTNLRFAMQPAVTMPATNNFSLSSRILHRCVTQPHLKDRWAAESDTTFNYINSKVKTACKFDVLQSKCQSSLLMLTFWHRNIELAYRIHCRVLLARIVYAQHTCIDAAVTPTVTWSVCLSVGLYVGNTWFTQKRLNRLRCGLICGLELAQVTMC